MGKRYFKKRSVYIQIVKIWFRADLLGKSSKKRSNSTYNTRFLPSRQLNHTRFWIRRRFFWLHEWPITRRPKQFIRIKLINRWWIVGYKSINSLLINLSYCSTRAVAFHAVDDQHIGMQVERSHGFAAALFWRWFGCWSTWTPVADVDLTFVDSHFVFRLW